MMTTSFGRKRDQRELLLRNLATSVILYESVVTTDAKGRAVQPIVERLIRVGQSPDALTARRRLLAYLTDENAVKKILNELAPRYSDRTSGFTRRFNLAPRKGDGAPQVMLQLVNTVLVEEPKAQTETKKKSAGKPSDKGESNE